MYEMHQTVIERDLVDYLKVFENLQTGIHIYHLEDLHDDTTLRLINANQAAVDFTGVPVDAIVGKTLDENFPGLRDLEIPQRYAEVVRSGKPFTIDELSYSDSQVEYGFFSVKAFPIPNNCVCVSFENITRRKKADDELKKQTYELRSLIDNMTIGFSYNKVVTDGDNKPVDHILLDINAAFERSHGFKREAVVGKKATDVFPGIKDSAFDWIGTLGNVALTGDPIVFEQYVEPEKRWYLISAYCPQKGYFALTSEDVTERRRANDELKQSEERYREMFSRMPSGVCVYRALDNGRDFVIKEFNRSAEKIERIISDEIIGKRVSEVFPGIFDFGLYDVLQRVWETGVAEFLPDAMYSDDRISKRWRENWVYKLGSGDIVAVYNDITDRKNTEINLRDALLHQHEIAKAGNVGLWDWDIPKNQVIYSLEWKKQIGYEEHEIGCDIEEWTSRIHPDDLEAALKSLKNSIANLDRNHRTVFRFRHKDGSYRWILEFGSVLQNEHGQACRMVGSHVDITERKVAAEKIKKNRALLNSLVNSLIDSMIVVDQNGSIRFVNNAACQLLGKKKHELVGAEFGFPVVLGEIFEIAVNMPDGNAHYAEVKSSMIDFDGNLSYLMSLRDVTAKKKAEEEHEKIAEHMRQVEKIDSIGKLAGGIAHDFNNMLSVIIGYSEELIEKLHKTDPLYECAREIFDAGRRSAELTRQLLAFSRKQTLQPEVLDLNHILKNIENVLRRLIGEDIEMETLIDGPLSRVKVDPAQIEQVIVNLAVNARDAMPQGGKLTIETVNVKIDEGYAATHLGVSPGDYVMLSVTDNGCGMDQKTKSQVFDPFFTTKGKGEGTGLGLSTVYGIVKQSGGNIWVYSEAGSGTTFKIYLPATVEEQSNHKSARSDALSKGRGELILVVEDEQSIRKLCGNILEKLNYSVEVAANGGEALLLVEERKLRPELIITDVVMPEMSGKIMIDRLKKTLPNLKVIYMSGYTDNTVAKHGLIDPDIPFIQKPFNKNKFGEKVRSVLDGGR